MLTIGIDEAGRGALAGPVCVCSACILNPDGIRHIELSDSKKMTPAKREAEMQKIVEAGALGYLNYIVSYQHSDTIDDINILNATKRGARVALGLAKLYPADNTVFKVDGNVNLVGKVDELPGLATVECVVKGDTKVPEIMLASIIAKCCRDSYMRLEDAAYPGYDFAKSKGYPSPKHMQAIIDKGPCEIHRKTFKRVKEYVNN